MPSRLYAFAVALASFSTIALELLLTRIYSVTMYYHFAFMVISLALLGLAVAGVALHLFPAFFARRTPGFWGAVAMLAFSGGVLLALAMALGHPISLRGWRSNLGTLVSVYLAASVPFLASGFALSLAIAKAGRHIGRIYAFDLVGAALGCLFMVPVLPALGAPGALVAVASLGAGSALLFALAARPPSRPVSRALDHGRPGLGLGLAALAAAAALGLGVLAVREPTHHLFGLARNPEKFLGNRPVLFEKWNAFSQITVAPSGDADHRWLFIDADAATRMWSGQIRVGGFTAPRRFPEVRVAGLVYAMRHGGTALIIGPGGGTDVTSALAHGVPRVVGVEVNPIIVNDVMRSTFGAWNGELYADPRVEVTVDEGRSFIRRSARTYASIQATLVDTWAASSSGAFTLSENNIYTVEAFEEFLDHLDPRGILAVTRWYDAASPKEFLRLVALGRAALEHRGVSTTDLPRHFAIATDNDRRATLLLARDPYDREDLTLLRATAARDGLGVLFTPGGTAGAGGEDPFLHAFLEAPSAGRALARLPYDARPTTDDHPFFFYNLWGRQLLSLFASSGAHLGALELNNLGVAILGLLLLLSLLMTLVLVAGPLLLLDRAALAADRGHKLRVLGYFMCLGLGYILVEIGFMQKFVLFLGHPIYALAVVLATLLAASGAGSALSGWGSVRFGTRGFVVRAVLALAGVLALYALGLTALFHRLLGLPIGLRVLVAVGLIAPPGILMGVLLPTGVRVAGGHVPAADPTGPEPDLSGKGERAGAGAGATEGEGRDLVAWAWSANGAASVVGSVLAMGLSMSFGFTLALGVGIAVYLGAATLLPPQRRHNQVP
jgi:spermidine synthase